MTFADSSIWIDYFNGKKTWQTDELDRLLQYELIVLGDIVLAEVLQGFRNDKDFSQAKSVLGILPCESICDKEIAIKSAENFRLLRKKGLTVRKTIDMLIGTYCIENDYILLHDDKDFEGLVHHLGLKVVSI